MEQKILTGCDYSILNTWFENSKSTMLVCGKSIEKQKINDYIKTFESKITRFSEFAPNPTYESVLEGVKLFRQKRCDSIVAIGGGSAIDVAKCIKAFSNMEGHGENGSFLSQEIKANNIPFLAIPTTAGTGSEATKFAVIYYNNEKQSITHESCIPDTVLLDASLLKTLPDYQRKATMCDALCHAIESFWSVNSTDESKEYSKDALEGILKHMNGYLQNTDEGNEGMLIAANIAGKAINITQTTAGHAMCYKLTSLFNIAHGHAAILCNRVLFSWMAKHLDELALIKSKITKSLSEIAKSLACVDPKVASGKLELIFNKLKLDIPSPTDEQYEILKVSVNPERLKNHPIAFNTNTIDYLYHKIMNKIDIIFANGKYNIPIVFDSDDIKTEISNLLSDYIADLNKHDIDDNIIECIEEFKDSCLSTFSNYFKGLHSLAFEDFKKAIKSLDLEDSPLVVTQLKNEILYRGRINQVIEDFTKDEMYHIPLTKRGIINTQRYSFPGLPCIYAGASAYTCWVEMNRPLFEQFQVAKLEYNDAARQKKIIDLSRVPQQLFCLKYEPWFKEEDYYLYWPLLALCSIKVRNEGDIFKPEYIFPQFYLEYILQKEKADECIGIRYASIKVASICNKQLSDDWHTYMNYVFPSRSDSTKAEKCEFLSSLFYIGTNRSGKELQVLTNLLNLKEGRDSFEWKDQNTERDEEYYAFKDRLSQRIIYTSDGKPFPYGASIFGLSEIALNCENFNIDTENILMASEIL